MTTRDRAWWWVKGQLESHGTSLSEIARTLGLSYGRISQVRRAPNHRIQEAIAEALDLEPWEIWPTRYTHRRPVRAAIWMKATTAENTSPCGKRRAA